jgi:hypothetical protein
MVRTWTLRYSAASRGVIISFIESLHLIHSILRDKEMGR